MSFTDQKSHTVTEKELKLSWGGTPNGSRFRCYLCGHKFEAGDVYRWVYGQGEVMNFLVCSECDGEDVLKRWIEHNKIAHQKFWWLFNR